MMSCTPALKVADAAMRAKAALKIAENEAAVCLRLLESYRELRANGNATERELERSQSDYMQAKARLENVREELAIFVRSNMPVFRRKSTRRRIRAPFDGYCCSRGQRDRRTGFSNRSRCFTSCPNQGH